jgi:fatty acid desaturase
LNGSIPLSFPDSAEQRKIAADFAPVKNMSRNFYILASTLALFALFSAAMSLAPSSFQPGLPANASLWRTVALILLLAGLASALVGVLSHLFEQVDRRNEEARLAARRKRRDGRKP